MNRDLRVLARAPAVEGLVVHLTDNNHQTLRVFEITLNKVPFEMRECFDPMTFTSQKRLCAQFMIETTDIATNKTSRETQWVAIDK